MQSYSDAEDKLESAAAADMDEELAPADMDKELAPADTATGKSSAPADMATGKSLAPAAIGLRVGRGSHRGKPRFTKPPKRPTYASRPSEEAEPPPRWVEIPEMSPDRRLELMAQFVDELVNKNALHTREERTALNPYADDPMWDGSRRVGRYLEEAEMTDKHIGPVAQAIVQDLLYTRNNTELNAGWIDFCKREMPCMYPEQVEWAMTAYKLLRTHGSSMLTWSMGSGKTTGALALYKKLKEEGEVKRLAILSTDMVLASWAFEIERLKLPGKIMRLSLAEFRDFGYMEELMHDCEIEFFLITLVTFTTEDSVLGLQCLFFSAPTMLAVDESHISFRKGEDRNAGLCLRQLTYYLAKKTMFREKMQRLLYVLFMSGSPVLNKPEEGTNSLRHLAFQTHIHPQGLPVPTPCSCKVQCNGERLTREVDPRGFTPVEGQHVFRQISSFGALENVKALAPSALVHLVVPPSTTEVWKHLSGPQLMRAHLTGHHVDLKKFPKWDFALKVIDASFQLDPNHSALCFVNNLEAIIFLAREAEHRWGSERVVLIHGGMDETEKKAKLGRLMNEDGIVTFMTPQLAINGINCQRATLCVATDEPWNPGEINQLVARMRRHGQRQGKQGFCLTVCLCSREDDSHKRVAEIHSGKMASTDTYYAPKKEEIKLRKSYEYKVKDLEPIKEEQVLAFVAGLRALGRAEKGPFFLPGKCFAAHMLSEIQQTKTQAGVADALRVLKPKLSPEERRARQQRFLDEAAAAARKKAEEAAAAAAAAEAAARKVWIDVFGDEGNDIEEVRDVPDTGGGLSQEDLWGYTDEEYMPRYTTFSSSGEEDGEEVGEGYGEERDDDSGEERDDDSGEDDNGEDDNDDDGEEGDQDDGQGGGGD